MLLHFRMCCGSLICSCLCCRCCRTNIHSDGKKHKCCKLDKKLGKNPGKPIVVPLVRRAIYALPDLSGMDVLQIILDNPNGWFYPGNFVSGTVILRTSEPVKARAVEVIFQGKAKTSWYVSESYRHEGKLHTENVLYSSEIMYVKESKCVWAPPPGQKHLPVGEMRFPFQFHIPPNAPPTFEGSFGFIRYFIKAKIDRPWRIDNRHQVGFTVLPHFDLNSLPYSGYPLLRDSHQEIGCCCFKHGRLMIRLIVQKSGFVPGELIPVRVEIQNHASKGVKKILTEVYQIQHFTAERCSNRVVYVPHIQQHANMLQKEHRQVVATTQKTFNEPRVGNWTFEDVLQLTPVVPSFNICQIIQVDYIIKVSVVTTSTFYSTVAADVPMLVGSIPVRNMIAMPAEGIRTGDTLVPPQPSAPPPDYVPQLMPAQVTSTFVTDDPTNEEKAPDYKPQYFFYPPAVPDNSTPNPSAPIGEGAEIGFKEKPMDNGNMVGAFGEQGNKMKIGSGFEESDAMRRVKKALEEMEMTEKKDDEKEVEEEKIEEEMEKERLLEKEEGDGKKVEEIGKDEDLEMIDVMDNINEGEDLKQEDLMEKKSPSKDP
uniref:Arrestin_C domain-containing protein n=1 Tax=Bursaphelenchus xylophilus TaxID=6326 RepID=A0A1I7SAY8_BURXY